MYRIRLSAMALLAAALILTSCRAAPSPLEAVRALYENELSPPAGIIYSTEAREGERDHLSPELLSAAYGIQIDQSGIISAALFLSSSGEPCELAVFYCKSRSNAEDVALFCRSRLDTILKNAASAAKFSGIPLDEYLEAVRNAAVTVSGRYVSLIISSDTAAARKLLYKLL